MKRTLVLDIGGVLFMGKIDDAFFSRWAEAIGLNTVALRQQIWYGSDIEAANIGQIAELAKVYGVNDHRTSADARSHGANR